MSKFLKKIVAFIIPLIILSVVADILISNGLKKSDYYAQGETFIWNEILEGNINSDIYIYGSSRAWVHIDPIILEDSLGYTAYNFGMDGQNFWLQHLRHKKLFKLNKKPEIILVSVDLYGLSNRKELYNYQQFYPFIFDSEIRNYTAIYEGINWYEYYLPVVRYSGRIKDLSEAFRSKDTTYYKDEFRRKGFRGVPRVWNDDFERFKSKITSYEITINNEYLDLLKSFVAECKKNNIQVIFIYTPEYKEAQKFCKNREDIISIYDNIAIKNNLLFLDFSNDSLCENNTYFYNSQHLNEAGSMLFSAKLADELKKRGIHILDSVAKNHTKLQYDI